MCVHVRTRSVYVVKEDSVCFSKKDILGWALVFMSYT